MSTVKNLLEGIRGTLESKPGKPIHIEISPNRARQLVEDHDKRSLSALKTEIEIADRVLFVLQNEHRRETGQPHVWFK